MQSDPTLLWIITVAVWFTVGWAARGLLGRGGTYERDKLRERIDDLEKELSVRKKVLMKLDQDLAEMQTISLVKPQAPGPLRDPPDALDDSERRLDERDRARECRREFGL